MDRQLQIKKGNPYPLGVTISERGVNFSLVTGEGDQSGILLIAKDGTDTVKIAFEQEYRCGNIAAVFVECMDISRFDYCFYKQNRRFADPYARRIIGNESWGSRIEESTLKCGFVCDEFDWGEDELPHIPYEDSIIYCLHVRGFTRHASSGVKNKGTIEGIIEKLPYLKELGITTLELMPCYEFLESGLREQGNNAAVSMEYAKAHLGDSPDRQESRLNYWGYQKAFYFAPKASYCTSVHPETAFKSLVKTMHNNGMEVMLQFYFPDEVKQGYILDVLKYWVTEYHIDGMHLMGNKIPITLIATEPLFANTKILYHSFCESDIYDYREIPSYRNLGLYRDDFMNCMRSFLKGDADMLSSVLERITENPEKSGIIHYMANYGTFTIRDMVTYDRKHNEENGESNRDGTDFNLSWNCGTEGPTRKKAILALRMKQMKNAFMLLFFSQGTPLLLMGDEFGRTRRGNNNSYCQDNEISWVNWKQTKESEEINQFVKSVIAFRKSHKILHAERKLSLLDRYSSGYPELSYHCEEPWRVSVEREQRHVGILYADCAAQEKNLVFIAYNMHWEPHEFSLPALPEELQWVRLLDSSDSAKDGVDTRTVSSRSIAVFLAKKE